MQLNLPLRNAEGLQANFRAADAIAQRQFRKAVEAHAKAVVHIAQVYCPVDTGFMRDHIRYELTPSGLVSDIGWWSEDFYNAGLEFYAVFQEFGTSRTPPQPSLIPAFMLLQTGYVDTMRRLTADSLRRGFR